MRSDIYQLLASMNYAKKDFELANVFFKKQLEIADIATKKEIEDNIKSTTINLADRQASSGDFMSAAESYLSLNTPESKRAAAKIYYENEKFLLAAKYFLELGTPETLKLAADSYSKAGEIQKSVDLWVQIANDEQNYDEKFKFFNAAWTMTDTLLKDFTQSIRLRESFIRIKPFSNKANMQKFFIIQNYFENNKFEGNDQKSSKILAAEKYIDLFNKLEDANIKSIDFGTEDRPISSLYFGAYTIYKNLGMEELSISLMQEFERKHPNNTEVKKYMREVLTVKYKESKQEDKYKELIEKIYADTPQDTLLTLNSEGKRVNITAENVFVKIAKDELKGINDSISAAFEKRNMREARKEIASFKHVYNVYTKKGLELNFDFLFEKYNFFVDYLKYIPVYESKLSKIDEVIKNDEFYKRIRVVSLTKIKRNFINQRLPKLKKMVKQATKKNLELIDERNEIFKQANDYGVDAYELSPSDLLYIYYTNAQIFEYATTVLDRKLQQYFEKSNEYKGWVKALTNNQEKLDEITNFINNTIKNEKSSYRMINKENPYDSSMGFYYIIYSQFYQKGYIDVWGFKAISKLKELGVPPFKNYEIGTFTSNKSWSTNSVQISGSVQDIQDTNNWFELYEGDLPVEQEFFEGNYDILLSEFDSYLKPNIDIEGPNELILVEYILDRPIEVILNNQLIETQSRIIDEIKINQSKYYIYNVAITKDRLKNLNNQLVLKVPTDKNSVAKQKYFKAKVSYFIDKDAKRDLVSINDIVSDENWKVTSITTNVSSIVDTNWITASTIIDTIMSSKTVNSFINKPSIIGLPENYQAITDTITFARKFELPVTISNAKLNFIGNNVSIIVNGVELDVSNSIQFDFSSNIIEPNVVNLPTLNQGKNTILIKSSDVTSPRVVFEILFDLSEE
ncbi:MAG: hypothetical protein U9N34_02770, partial [Candidatus Cloacimonadota bacterium]|nr:hypothetical protein [Candidatus Cloacimonadota bacterium]